MARETRATSRALPREREMEAAIREGVARLGGYVWSVPDSRRTATADMPDLIIAVPRREVAGATRPGIVALVELKSQARPVTPGQRHALGILAGCTDLVTGIVRPVPREGEMSYDALLRRLGITDMEDGR